MDQGIVLLSSFSPPPIVVVVVLRGLSADSPAALLAPLDEEVLVPATEEVVLYLDSLSALYALC